MTTLEMTSPATTRLIDGYSVEITAKDGAKLQDAARFIPRGSKVSVTYLPNEGEGDRVAAAAEARRLGLEPVPHISARRIASKAQLEAFLTRLSTEARIEKAFVVAGDVAKPLGPYEDTLSVIRSGVLQAHGVRAVGLAGHPDGHPDVAPPVLWAALKDKAAALAAEGLDCEIVTQFVFEAGPVLAWLEALRQHGVEAPVRIGLPGPASAATLLRFAARCGVATSTKVLSRYGISMTKLMNTAGPDRLVEDLVARLDPARHGQVGVHLYPFGGVSRAAEWAWNATGKSR